MAATPNSFHRLLPTPTNSFSKRYLKSQSTTTPSPPPLLPYPFSTVSSKSISSGISSPDSQAPPSNSPTTPPPKSTTPSFQSAGFFKADILSRHGFPVLIFKLFSSTSSEILRFSNTKGHNNSLLIYTLVYPFCFINLTIVCSFNFRQLFTTSDGGTIALDWVTYSDGILTGWSISLTILWLTFQNFVFDLVTVSDSDVHVDGVTKDDEFTPIVVVIPGLTSDSSSAVSYCYNLYETWFLLCPCLYVGAFLV